MCTYIAPIFLVFTILNSTAVAEVDLSITSNSPSFTAYVAEDGVYEISAKNKSAVEQKGILTLVERAPGEAASASHEWPVTLEPNTSNEYHWNISTQNQGYLALTATFAQGTEAIARSEAGILIVPRASETLLTPKPCFLGSMFTCDVEAAKQIGIGTDRWQAVWGWVQPEGFGSDSYYWDDMDREIQHLVDAGLGVVLTIRPEVQPSWASWTTLEELSSKEHIAAFGKFVSDVVRCYQDKILAVEIMNEPDLECGHGASGKISTAAIYTRFLNEGDEASKSAAPELPVIGISVSGVDFPHLAFSKEVLSRGGQLDIIGGHPYNNFRYLGGDARPESPLKMDAAQRMSSMAKLMRERGLEPRIWCTEFGWALHIDEPMSSAAARLYAAYTAQAIILTRTVPEVEKLFWFSTTFPGQERSSSYGLFRKADKKTNFYLPYGNWFPAPSAAAYATCSQLLEGAHFINNFKIGEFCHAFHFTRADSDDAIICLWTDDFEYTGGAIELELKDERLSPANLYDALGRKPELAKNLPIGPLPIFIQISSEGTNRLITALKEAHPKAGKLIMAMKPIALEGRDHILPADPGIQWSGHEDLSMSVIFGWSQQGLLIQAKVQDNIHIPAPANAFDPWSYDSLQVAIDRGNRADFGYDDDCFEFTFSGGPDRSSFVGNRERLSSDFFVITRKGNITEYQVLFPWSVLGETQFYGAMQFV